MGRGLISVQGFRLAAVLSSAAAVLSARAPAFAASMSSGKILTTHPRQTAPSAADLRWKGPPGMRVVLGSKSFTRKLLLGELGVPFECVPADIDEKAIRDPDPEVLVMKLANAKADALAARPAFAPSEGGQNTLLLTSDQVVVFEGQIREKPESADEAREFIRGYGRSPCRTVGAIVVRSHSPFDTALRALRVCRRGGLLQPAASVPSLVRCAQATNLATGEALRGLRHSQHPLRADPRRRRGCDRRGGHVLPVRGWPDGGGPEGATVPAEDRGRHGLGADGPAQPDAGRTLLTTVLAGHGSRQGSHVTPPR